MYVREGERKKYRLSLPWGTQEFDVTVLGHGDLADPSFSATLVARIIDSQQGHRSVINRSWPSETLGDLDDEN
ncbi:MAG: hypothetical protein Q8P59_01460, partial [Dehalococcoidia bacterium]|nr:hypothetical protein [Dehalococcoidia bacterium]